MCLNSLLPSSHFERELHLYTIGKNLLIFANSANSYKSILNVSNYRYSMNSMLGNPRKGMFSVE